jgi:hypothetical protein
VMEISFWLETSNVELLYVGLEGMLIRVFVSICEMVLCGFGFWLKKYFNVRNIRKGFIVGFVSACQRIFVWNSC